MKKLELGYTVVDIEWEDAWSNEDYWTIEEVARDKGFILHLVGFVIRNDKTGMTVAKERLPSSGGKCRFRGVHHVPKAMIRKVTVLNG